jgi:hypothetical protein
MVRGVENALVLDERRQFGGGDHDVDRLLVDVVVVFLHAIGASSSFHQTPRVEGNFLFVEFELDEGHKEGSDEGAASHEDVEEEEEVENVSYVPVLLHLDEDLVYAALIHLVKIVEKGRKEVSEIGTVAICEHQHRETDVPIQEE